MPDAQDMPVAAPKEKIETLTKKADQLSDFGTLTSLVSTAAYFVENTFVKKLPKWVNMATLGAVSVGIGSVFTAYYYKLKAGRIAIDAAERKQSVCKPPPPLQQVEASPRAGGFNSPAKWVEEIETVAKDPKQQPRR